MSKQAIIFDLDGTLADTLRDLAFFMNSILKDYGFPEHPVESYRYKVGGGMRNLVVKSLPSEHISDSIVSECEEKIVDVYYKKPVVHTTLYPGIPGLLSDLEKLGTPKSILSNKTHSLVLEVVDILLSSYNFVSVWGAKEEFPKKPDPASALAIARELRFGPSEILYCGDSGVDMETARNAGMTALGVLWGFRDKEELAEHGAEIFAEKPEDILQIVQGGS